MSLFRPQEESAVRDMLAAMERDVELVLVLGPEETPLPAPRPIDYSAEARRLLEELVTLGERLSLRVVDAPELGVERFPAICVLPEGEDVGIRYFGLPWGYELSTIVGACVEAGRPESSLSEDSLAALAGLERDISLEVFVTPT